VRIPFVDLAAQHGALRGELDAAAARVLDRSWFILGEEVAAFEAEFARYCGAAHCVGVGNGMDALELALRACGVGPGDEVVTVSHTFFATAAAISAVGATPVFVDVEAETGNIDVRLVEGVLSERTRALMPVHLYGRCAEAVPLMELAEDRGLWVIEDAAQAHGAGHDGRRAGTLGHVAAFSFYPTKNLGALGDGGAVVTSDDEVAERVARTRNYGQLEKYVHPSLGRNSRLDEVQAAFLRVKLPHLDAWNSERQAIARAYCEGLEGSGLGLSAALDPAGSVHHLFVVTSPRRDELASHLAERGVETQLHYPVPVHLQEAYRAEGRVAGSLEVTERLANEVLSLPIYPGLDESGVRYVCESVRELTG